MRIRVKICGITAPEDAAAAAAAGADAIGLVFHDASPRRVSLERAAAVAAALPPFVDAVAVVLDPEPALVDALAANPAIDWVQFHGREDPELCARAGARWIKAVPMAEAGALADCRARYPGAAAFLLDSHAAGQAGGRGETFAWEAVERGGDPRPLILAGGLGPDNVAAACRAARPWGVDASSGVERAPGRKDPALMAAFAREARHAA